MSDYPKPKKTHASNSARLVRLGRLLKNDNSTVWVGLNRDRDNAPLFVAAYDDENGFTPIEGYFRTMSDAVSELEGVLNAESLPPLAPRNSDWNDAIDACAQLARDRGEYEISKKMISMKKFLVAFAFLFAATFCSAQTKVPKSAVDAVVSPAANSDGDNEWLIFSGDTIKCRIRVTNAPEGKYNGICTERQPGFQESKDALRHLLPKGAKVKVDTSAGRDQYDRILIRAWRNIGTESAPIWQDVALKMLEDGLVWYVYDERCPRASLEKYRAAFKNAKKEHIGLWDEELFKAPIYPGDWLKLHRPKGGAIVFRAMHPALWSKAKKQ